MHTLLRGGLAAVALLSLALASGCGAGSLDAGEQTLRDHWSELVSAHRQRAELAPALVSAVRGQPGIDDAAVAAVSQARARVAAMTVPMRQLPGPEVLGEFQRSQDALGHAIARLLAMSESHPGLITEPRYIDVRRRLEANERRLTAGRTRYVHAVQDFNARLERLPLRLAAGALGLERQPTLAPEGSPALPQAATAASR
jgi:LemA protein